MESHSCHRFLLEPILWLFLFFIFLLLKSKNCKSSHSLPYLCNSNVILLSKGPLPRRHTIEQWVPRGFSFDQDTSQQGHQEQDNSSSPYNRPGTAMTRTGRWSLININTWVHGISWLLNAFSPNAASAYCPGTVVFMKSVYGSWAPLGHL